MTDVVFDAGGLIALERRHRPTLALVEVILRARGAVHVSAGVLAQVWRGGPRQHAIGALLRTEFARVHPLDRVVALRIGALLARSGTSDVVDAHVALLGRALGAKVLTSDPDDLRRLDGSLDLLTV